MAVYELTIAGASVTVTAEDAWNISAPQNGQATFEATLWADAVGDIAATFDDEVVLTEDGVAIFGGNIVLPNLGGIGGKGTTAVKLSITANDYNTLASRRIISSDAGTIPEGQLRNALVIIAPWIPGVTLAGTQVLGPHIAGFSAVHWKPQAALDYLTQATGYLWRIYRSGVSRLLEMFAPGSIAAPFDIDQVNGVVEGDVTVSPKRYDYANHIYVDGTGAFAEAKDDAEIATYGPWELFVLAPDVTTNDAAQALAASMLAAKLIVLKQVQYVTLLSGLVPGMTQTITLPARGLSNTFLITEVNTNYARGIARRTVTAIEGTVYQPGWRENTRTMFGGGGTSFAGGGGGGGGTAGALRYAYPLGGAEGIFKSSPVPTWVDAVPNAVQVDPVARGTRSATIVAQLRALTAGVSVQARLFDVTANAAIAGVSAVVTSTTWQTVTWTVTLATSAHYYRLQILPGAPNEDCGATGYLE